MVEIDREGVTAGKEDSLLLREARVGATKNDRTTLQTHGKFVRGKM